MEALQARVTAATAQGSISACLRMVANVWALLQVDGLRGTRCQSLGLPL